MTGAILCRRLLESLGIEGAITIGRTNHYVPGERLIVLREHCYRGTSRKNLTLAAHEVGHAEQEQQLGWAAPALRWVMPGRLWLEWDASRRARVMLALEGIKPHEDALEDCWRSYLAPALWQMGLMAAIASGWLLWRAR